MQTRFGLMSSPKLGERSSMELSLCVLTSVQGTVVLYIDVGTYPSSAAEMWRDQKKKKKDRKKEPRDAWLPSGALFVTAAPPTS